MSGGANTISIKADTRGIDLLISQMASDIEAAVRPAAQAAAQVLYDEVKRNVSSIGKKTGNLQRSVYQVYSQTNSRAGVATYHVSWNARTAPHGHLVEYGHLMRYKMIRYADGSIRPAVRPEMRGKKKPARRASQATKDAYYVTLPTPVQVAARPFIRPAVNRFEAAMEAAKNELMNRMNGAAA